MLEINTLKQLKEFDCLFDGSFSIRLRQQEFQGEKVLRILPKKRIVALGRWKEKPVVAKLFFSGRAESHMRRETKGIWMLSRAKILTPAILLYGQSAIPGVYFILYEYIEHKADIQDLWINKQPPQALQDALLSMQDILIKQHQNGMYYVDLHPHNFILGKDHVYLIDPAEVKCENFRLALSVNQSIQNLVVLYAQLAPKFQAMIISAFQRYCSARGWKIMKTLEPRMLGILYQNRCERLKRYLRKSLTTCRHFVAKRAFSYRYACVRSEFSASLKAFFTKDDQKIHEHDILKNGNTCTTFKTMFNNKTVVIKRYNIKSFWHLIRICWRKSRAMRSWENANALALLCIPSPKPIAFYENRFLWFFHGRAYFVFEYAEGNTLQDYLSTGAEGHQAEEIMQQVTSLFHQFSLMHIVHGDTKATNFLLNEGKIQVLDLDAMMLCQNKRQFAKGHKKDRDRLLKDWENYPEILKYFKE